MIFPKMQASRVSEKNISEFYGVNRTAKINDFQLSEMKNMDCEAFPFVMTRKSREKIYPLETEKGTPSPMKLICANDDIFDDYSVTGVTADGAFVYRGEVIESRKLDLSRSESIVLHGGYFVTFPDMNAFYVDNGAVETEPANKKSRGNEVKIGERRGEKKGYSKQIAAKASIKKSGSSTAC